VTEIIIFFRDGSPLHSTVHDSFDEALAYFRSLADEGAWHYFARPA
jgi:hypothetical protein